MTDIKKLSMEELEQQLAAKNKNIEQISRKLELLSSLTPKRILGEATFDKQSIDLADSDLQISMQTKFSNDSDKTSNFQQSQLPPKITNVSIKREIKKDSLNTSRNKNQLNTSNNGESSDAVMKAMKALQQKITDLESENSLLQQHLHKRDAQYSTEQSQFREKIQTEINLQNEQKLKIIELEKLCKHFENELKKKDTKFQKLQNELQETKLKEAVANEEKKIIQNEKERHLEAEQREWETMEQERKNNDLQFQDKIEALSQRLVDTQLELKEALNEKQKLIEQNSVFKNKIQKQSTQTRNEPSPAIKEFIDIFSRLVEYIKPELNKFANRSELNSIIIKGNKTINKILLKQQSGGLKENTKILNKCPPSGKLKQKDKQKCLRSNSMNKTKFALQSSQQSPTSAFFLSVLDLENSKVKETKKIKKFSEKSCFDNCSYIKLNDEKTLNIVQNNSINLLNSRITEIEVSEQIWKEERNIVQLKKEVRNLMNQSQSTINNEKLSLELEQTNQALQQKTEYLTRLRQQQKEFIAQALVK